MIQTTSNINQSAGEMHSSFLAAIEVKTDSQENSRQEDIFAKLVKLPSQILSSPYFQINPEKIPSLNSLLEKMQAETKKFKEKAFDIRSSLNSLSIEFLNYNLIQSCADALNKITSSVHPKEKSLEEMITVIQNNPILEQHLLTLRDPKTSLKDFRYSLKIAGQQIANKIAAALIKKNETVTTLTKAQASHEIIKDSPVLIPIMRAGLPMHEGFIEIFRDAEIGFLAIKRDKNLNSKIFYESIPEVNDKVVILIDPMFATGASIEIAIKSILNEKPKEIFFASLFSTNAGILRINRKYPQVKLYTGVIDPILNQHGYIIPGLGDAGDRAFGKPKIKR